MGNNSSSLKKHYATAEKTGVLNVSKCKLEELPPEVLRLSHALRSLDVSYNKLAVFPSTIGSFSLMKTLILDHNHLSSLPHEIGQLTKLETLSLEANRINGLPDSIIHLVHLKRVNLKHNQIKEFPLVFCGSKHLELLDLSQNKLTCVPAGASQLSVTELVLDQNQISEIHEDLAMCSKLRTLKVQENCLPISGFPAQLLSDSNVFSLQVEGNLFEMKAFMDLPGYDKYMERYTAVKKKLY